MLTKSFTILFVFIQSLLTFVYSQHGIYAIKSIAGKKAAIECVTDGWDENDVQLVLWYREDSEYGADGSVPFYRLDARHRQLFKAKHVLQNQSLEHRFVFDVTLTPPALVIHPVLVSDEGWYRCRVDYKTSRTQSYSAYLEVIGPPEELKIVDTSGAELSGLIGPYDEFANVVLVCEARAGNPSPALIWYHINALEVIIDNTYAYNRTGIVTNDLHLRQLDRHDYRTRLACRASSSSLYDPIERSVIIDMNLKPLSAKITTLYSRPLIAGRISEFRCLAEGSRPEPRIVWKIGDTILASDPPALSGDGNGSVESVVEFTPTADHNDRELICLADNPLIANSSVEDRLWISVEFSPIINISLDPNHSIAFVNEGDYIRVKCEVLANPWVTSIEWSLNGKRVQNPVLIDKNQTLVIDNILRDQSGRYQCTAGNGIGRTISPELNIEVNYAPVCRKGQQIHYTAVRNLATEVRCLVDTRPVDSSVRFKWFVNTSVETFELKAPDVRPVPDDPTASVATYRPKTALNYAMVLCLAENRVGPQVEPCVYYLRIHNGPPESVRNCDITHTSAIVVSVECMAGNNGGLRADYHLEVYHSLTEQLMANYTALQPKFVVESLVSDVSYNLVIYSSNDRGNSPPLTYPSVRLLLTDINLNASKTQKDITPLMNSLIGIVVSIVIFTICVALVVKIRRFIYEDEYRVYDDGRGSQSESDGDENNDRDSLMAAHASNDSTSMENNSNAENNSRLNRWKHFTNRLKLTKRKTFETNSRGVYRKVTETQPNKQIVTFATFDEFMDELNHTTDTTCADSEGTSGTYHQHYEERAIDVNTEAVGAVGPVVTNEEVSDIKADNTDHAIEGTDKFECYCCKAPADTVVLPPIVSVVPQQTPDPSQPVPKESVLTAKNAKRFGIKTRRQYFRKSFFRKTL